MSYVLPDYICLKQSSKWVDRYMYLLIHSYEHSRQMVCYLAMGVADIQFVIEETRGR